MGKATVGKARQVAAAATTTVDVPEWGGEVTIRRASLADARWARSQIKPDEEFDADEFENMLLARCIIEPDLGEDGPDIIRKQPIGVGKKLVDAFNAVSGVAEADQFRPADDA